MPESENKFVKFLIYWISGHNTKAVTTLKNWKRFFREWEERLKDRSDELKNPFFAFFRGIVTPYRKKYAKEDNLSITDNDNKEKSNNDEITNIINIINRHYATVEYLITEDPSIYEGKDIKIDKDRIVSLKGFFYLIEKDDNQSFEQFFQDNRMEK